MAKTLVYQMWPLAWDGLQEMTAFLPRVAALDVDYVWLSPVYCSPQCDHGYDVSDYMRVNPNLGSMEDFDDFVEAAHVLGLRVVMDLPINHTSTSHQWFLTRPELYCWSKYDKPNWRNLFAGNQSKPQYFDCAKIGHPGWCIKQDPGGAWTYDKYVGEYYLHLFCEEQADLNWFPDGELNRTLVYEFQKIIDFWVNEHFVDGFRIDCPQAVNKDFSADFIGLSTLFYGSKSIDVINAIFDRERYRNLFLIAEVFDPTYTEIIKYHTSNTPIDFALNPLVKEDLDHFFIQNYLALAARNPQFMLDFESHDSPRACGYCRIDNMVTLFKSGAQGICLYQGQELGLLNPTKVELPDGLMYDLDAKSKMRHLCGEDPDTIRATSRANARIHLPMDVYDAEEQDSLSCLAFTKCIIRKWKNE